MNRLSSTLTMLLLAGSFLNYLSCEARQQAIKKANIAQAIEELQPTSNQEAPLLTASAMTKAVDADDIIGLWQVSNEYYVAVYEIEKHEDTYVGKVHYFNDGQTEYTGKNTEEDYFLAGITFENGQYINGKMHLPDGSFYYVNFTLKGDELTAKMTVESQPYTEVWKRKQ